MCPQPALLYLVPACVGFPVIVALFKGELTEMFRCVSRAAAWQISFTTCR